VINWLCCQGRNYSCFTSKFDGQSEIKEPIGMYGGRLESSFHVVVGQASSIRNVGDASKVQEFVRIDIRTISVL
jgi:cell division ATPase FtsA